MPHKLIHKISVYPFNSGNIWTLYYEDSNIKCVLTVVWPFYEYKRHKFPPMNKRENEKLGLKDMKAKK